MSINDKVRIKDGTVEYKVVEVGNLLVRLETLDGKRQVSVMQKDVEKI